jgi:hypothetical protein
MPVAESRLQLVEHLAMSIFRTCEMGPLEMPAPQER